MAVSVETIGKNFQSKADTELAQLASSRAEISSESRCCCFKNSRAFSERRGKRLRPLS